MALDMRRQVLGAFMTLSMFAMLANMIRREYFKSVQVSQPDTGHIFAQSGPGSFDSDSSSWHHVFALSFPSVLFSAGWKFLNGHEPAQKFLNRWPGPGQTGKNQRSRRLSRCFYFYFSKLEHQSISLLFLLYVDDWSILRSRHSKFQSYIIEVGPTNQ